jgi:transposase-like protein
MTISFARHQFPPEIIRHAVWLYVRFTLSYRDVEDLLAERGLGHCHMNRFYLSVLTHRESLFQ